MIIEANLPARRDRTQRVRRPAVKRIAVVGNYSPRQCGIATFTTDLCEALASEYEEISCFALPVNDKPAGYAYPPRVRFELDQDDLASYRSAADFLNFSNVDLVCLQHEYGIFGGPAGSHILTLLRELRVPLVTTLHTVLKDPDRQQRRVMDELTTLSDRIVVMSERGADFVRDIYGVDTCKIDMIPHGIPDVAFVDSNFHKDRFGLEGKTVVLTFGLLSPSKGIEHMIRALPAVVERFPKLVYIVLGATHPHVRAHSGEAYRESLQQLARSLSVDQHVVFDNRFVSIDELVEFIGAADIYITPYLSPAQITSGTLAYAAGAGKAVISTPYWYAEELLGDGRGILVPFGDSEAISERMIALLENEKDRHAMRKKAYLLGRQMTWPRVARRYMQSFRRASEERSRNPRAAAALFAMPVARERAFSELPPTNLDHIERLSDETGLLQHAIFAHPNYDEGYTTDDNARALVLATQLEQTGVTLSKTHRYQALLWHAFNRNRSRFRNFLSYDRRWLDEVGSEDCHGRAVWALGTVLGRSRDSGLRGSAGRLFDLALPAVTGFTSPRAWAFSLLGLNEYLKAFPGDRSAQSVRDELLRKLVTIYQQTQTRDWDWFEPVMSYANARLPQSLLVSGAATGRDDLLDLGLQSLRWLAGVQTCENDHFVPVGSNGFYPRGGVRARFDQQPIEAHATVSACLDAWRITRDSFWYREARKAFDWFLGRNDLGLALLNAATGGCRDGLHPDRVNQNEGAESTLSFVAALEELRQVSSADRP